MKRLALTALFVSLLLPSSALGAKSWLQSPNGGFEVNGYLNTGVGFQHFSDAANTEVADDGSPGGPIGEWLPITNLGARVSPGEDFFQVFIPNFELDIVKHFGTRARLRADIQMGRPNSGSQVGFNTLSHAYGAVTLSEKQGLELVIGRFGMPPGFEPYEAYYNDTVSWSILWRSLIVPGSGTGAMLNWAATDAIDIMIAAANGFVHDWSFKENYLPCFMGSMLVTWGNEAQPSTFVLAPYFGPESGYNRPFTIGANATLTWWMSEHWQLGLEGDYQRNNAVAGIAGAEDTSYVGALLNIHWEPTPAWYGVARYTMAWQNAPGNGIMNLTGAEQVIHEMSLGMGYFIADGVKLKVEGRFDIIDPKHSDRQWVSGAAMSLGMAY